LEKKLGETIHPRFRLEGFLDQAEAEASVEGLKQAEASGEGFQNQAEASVEDFQNQAEASVEGYKQAEASVEDFKNQAEASVEGSQDPAEASVVDPRASANGLMAS
jgi:molecular chaperone GrpE (heat shock protein)